MKKTRKKNSSMQSLVQNKTRLFRILFLAVVCAMVFKGLMQFPQIMENKERSQQITEQIAYEEQRQKEIDELRSKVNTDEYIEKAATEKLGLVKKNAKIFVDISSEE